MWLFLWRRRIDLDIQNDLPSRASVSQPVWALWTHLFNYIQHWTWIELVTQAITIYAPFNCIIWFTLVLMTRAPDTVCKCRKNLYSNYRMLWPDARDLSSPPRITDIYLFPLLLLAFWQLIMNAELCGNGKVREKSHQRVHVLSRDWRGEHETHQGIVLMRQAKRVTQVSQDSRRKHMVWLKRLTSWQDACGWRMHDGLRKMASLWKWSTRMVYLLSTARQMEHRSKQVHEVFFSTLRSLMGT